MNQLRKRMLDDLKKKTDPVDASDMIEMILHARDKLTKEEKDNLIEDMEKGFTEAGNLSLLRAFEEEIVTEKEWLEMKDKYGFTIEEMGTVLGGYFGKQKMKDKGDDVIVVTLEDTNIYKHKEYIYDRFGVIVMSPKDAMEKIDKNKVTDIMTSKLK